jgi:hypothetical protein
LASPKLRAAISFTKNEGNLTTSESFSQGVIAKLLKNGKPQRRTSVAKATAVIYANVFNTFVRLIRLSG